MRVRVRKQLEGVIDGVPLSRLVPGRTYDVSASLGEFLIDSDAADEFSCALEMPQNDAESEVFVHLAGGGTAPQMFASVDHPRRDVPDPPGSGADGRGSSIHTEGMFHSASPPPLQHTGLVCPVCRRPVAIIEKRLPQTVAFHCPACGRRWSADEPGTPKL